MNTLELLSLLLPFVCCSSFLLGKTKAIQILRLNLFY